MAKRLWMALLLVSCVGAAVAGRPGGVESVRQQVESTMVVTGTIDLHPDGRVLGYALNPKSTLPQAVVEMIAGTLPQWRFDPVEAGEAADTERSTMSLRLVAKELDNGDFRLQIRGAHFGQGRPGEAISSARLNPPRYPQDAAMAGVGGTVYAVVKIGRDGRVLDAVAEQVNLRILASERDMTRWRELLAKATLRALKQWKFTPPTHGADMDAPYWCARVPVDFVAPGTRKSDDDRWQAYVPGPRQLVPWATGDDPAQGADALAGGGVYPMGVGRRLLSPLDPS